MITVCSVLCVCASWKSSILWQIMQGLKSFIHLLHARCAHAAFMCMSMCMTVSICISMQTCSYFHKFIRFVQRLHKLCLQLIWFIFKLLLNNQLANFKPKTISWKRKKSCIHTGLSFFAEFWILKGSTSYSRDVCFSYSITILYPRISSVVRIRVRTSKMREKSSCAVESESKLIPFWIVLINIANINTFSFIITAKFTLWKICFAQTHSPTRAHTITYALDESRSTDRWCAHCSWK